MGGLRLLYNNKSNNKVTHITPLSLNERNAWLMRFNPVFESFLIKFLVTQQREVLGQ